MRERLAHIKTRSSFPYARHVFEMFVAMQLGMMVGPLLLAVALGTDVSAAKEQHDIVFALVMGLGMTAPMVAWMLYRGHSWRSAAEMAGVMLAPAVPLVALKAAHVVTGPVSGPYMCVSMLAMIALIVYRRGEYRTAASSHAQPAGA
jgi:hypothetical protein